MALWPFGRKKRKAQQRADEKSEKDDEDLGITTRITGPEGTKLVRKGRDSKPSSKQSSRKVSKTRELEPALPPPPPVPALPRTLTPTKTALNEKQIEPEQSPAAPARQPLSELKNPEEAPPLPPFAKSLHNNGSESSLQPENFTVTGQAPTLRPARSSVAESIPRRKSSKRKADARAREQEIKSMSAPIPIPKRPRSYTSGLLARDSKKVPGGLNRNLERPTSEVSLPLAESLRSSIADSPDMYNSFRVSAFDALSPRPTIRYSDSPRQMGSPYGASRTSTRKDKGPVIPEEDFSPKARIDKLADDMDASGLRELMDRDRRRRERRKKSDREKLERRLQRRLEKQKVAMTGEAGPSGTSGDVVMSDVQDTGVEISDKAEPRANYTAEGSAEPEAGPAPKEEGPRSPESWLQDPSREHLESEYPFVEQSHLDLGTDDEKDEPVLETAQAVRLSQASMSPPSSPVLQQHARGPSNLSNVTNAAPLENIPEPPPSDYLQPSDIRRDSETSARAGGSSWKSFFRRGTTSQRESSDRGRGTPSEFSNTSRESFIRQNRQPPPVVIKSYTPKDGTPKRTRSKFREDLPELPISPPTSRFQSPGSPHSPVSPKSPYIDNPSKVDTMDDRARVSTPIGDVHPAFREEVTLSRGHSMRSDTPEGASAALLSQSLASVDSEGSWLSGKPQKRSSIPINSFRESAGSLSEHVQEESDRPEEYFARRETNVGKEPARSGIASQLRRERSRAEGGDGADSLDPSRAASPSEAEPIYAKVPEGKATLVQSSPAFKSREGLLDMFNAGEGDDDQEVSPVSSHSADTATETSPAHEIAPVSVHRATSVEYGKGHSRTVSVGSARLLDIPARSSTEMKRSSVSSSQQGSPLIQQETREHD